MARGAIFSLCSSVAVVFTIIGLAAPASGDTFLARDPASLKDDSSDLLSELSRVAGDSRSKAVQARVGLLEESLRPTFMALPHDGVGDRVRADAVRYLLHRLFVERHGWYVRGLHAEGQAWNSSSAAEVFKGRSAEVHELFEQRLSDGGFTLHEVAVLASTLESFVHEEAVHRLRSTYRLLDFPESQDVLSEQQVLRTLDVYMMVFLSGMDHNVFTKRHLAIMDEQMDRTFPHWNQTKTWVQEVHDEVLSREFRATPPTSFDTTLRALEEISERYGRWQDMDCKDMKSKLQRIEHGSSGRVRLEDFYGAALNGDWQFSESKAFLRDLGTLDESDPLKPSVIIPNYINSPSNCIAASKFYKVCCVDECEGLVANLERQIAAPSSSPARIAELVSTMPSATVAAPRKLPDSLTGRLEEIAQIHGGKVPLHGRLFAQWLHYAYPRECQMPSLNASAASMSKREWQQQTGERANADEAAMRLHIEEANRTSRAAVQGDATAGAEIPWEAEEQLFLNYEAPKAASAFSRVGALAVMAASGVSMTLFLAKSSSGLLSGARSIAVGSAPSKSLKHMV